MDTINNFNASNIINSPTIQCECGCKIFEQGSILKSVSALVSPTGKNEIIPIPVFVCRNCGKICKEMLEKANASKILGEEEIKNN